MELTRYIDANLHVFVVIVASTFLCVACLCLLIRAYRRKFRSRGKEKELQRPFIKRKRPFFPKKSPLLGNLNLSNGHTLNSKSSTKRHEDFLPSPIKKLSKGAESTDDFCDNNELLGDCKTRQSHFLGEVFASINQQKWEKSQTEKNVLRKFSPKKMKNAKVMFTSNHRTENVESCGSISEQREGLDDSDARISFVVDKETDSKMYGAIRKETPLKVVHTSSGYAGDDDDQQVSFKSYISGNVAKISKEVMKKDDKSKHFRVRWQQTDSSVGLNTSAVTSPESPGSLWAHKCSCKSSMKKIAENIAPKTRWIHKFHWKPPAMGGKLSKFNKSQTHDCNDLDSDERLNSSPHVKVLESKSFLQGSNHNDDPERLSSCSTTPCTDLMDISKGIQDKSQYSADKRAADTEQDAKCEHDESNTSSSVVKSASKTEVYCSSCGMTLSKPQCFYSLGSLCTDEEICETDSDDINRHPVGDIDINVFSPFVDSQSHNNDTGYTSTDEFENDLASYHCCEKTDTCSYDGDYESDSEETVTRSVIAMGDDLVVKPLPSIGELISIEDYALREWKSDTPKSVTMKKGYASISSLVSCHHLRQIRGDNYCSIRAVLFQALAGGLPILQRFETRTESKLDLIVSSLISLDNTKLELWSFANRFPVPQEEVKTTLEECLRLLSDQVHRILACCSDSERVDCTLAMFSDETEELKVLEAVKLLMYDTSVELFDRLTRGQDTPLFAMLLFARDSSDLPSRFLTSHLNKTGDTGGLEQVEMCLLAYTLGLVIQVIRPSQVDRDDFIAYYPSLDDVPKYTPTITLIAEDDRHYNIVL